MRKSCIILTTVLFMAFTSLFSQNEGVKPGIVGDKFSDFTLQTYQGSKFSTSDLRGKNILLISSRGKYNDQYWCGICFYQYADFADLVLNQKIKEKYNLEIVFLMPYNNDTLKSWEMAFPGGITYLENSKNPADTSNLSEGQKGWMEFTRAHYPKTFDFKDGKIPMPIPVLVDDKQEVSKGLDIMRMEWDGTNVMQNIPAVYIIDKDGILRFKYISQSTIDRPSSEYILNMVKSIQ